MPKGKTRRFFIHLFEIPFHRGTKLDRNNPRSATNGSSIQISKLPQVSDI